MQSIRSFIVGLAFAVFALAAFDSRAAISTRGFDLIPKEGSVASGSATATFTIPIPADMTVLLEATIVVSHFSGGHQNAGGSILSAGTFENQNGTVTLVPALATTGGGPLGTNPLAAGQPVPPTGDVIITGGTGLSPWSAVWTVSGTNALMTITNQTGSTAGFDFRAWVVVYKAAST